MSFSTESQKGLGGFFGRIFGSGSAAQTVSEAPELLAPVPRAPEPMVSTTPQVLIPRKGVGTMLRRAVQPGLGSNPAAEDLWTLRSGQQEDPRIESPCYDLNAHAEKSGAPAKAASRLLALPRTVLSMLKKAPPPREEFDFTEPAPIPDPAFTRRKERDYPII